MKRAWLLWWCALVSLQVHAMPALPLAEDPLVEKRLLAIAEEVRCLVCQNESLAGSHADLAQDLRREIRQQIVQGQTDAQIMEFLVSRYGDFVRYRPPVKPVTWLLWGGPFVLLGVGLGGLWYGIRKRRTLPCAPLTEQEQRLANELLATPPDPQPPTT